MLRLLRGHDAVRIVMPSAAPGKDECRSIGNMAYRAERMGAGHAAYVALVNAAGLVTSRADQIRAVLGPQWVVLEV
jgi:uncharacterized protein YbjT (DUF2867 family)